MPHDHASQPAPSLDGAPDDLSHAGAIVDQAISYMTGQNISGVAMASALLGGAVTMLARSLSEDDVVRILGQAADSVRAGEFRPRDA